MRIVFALTYIHIYYTHTYASWQMIHDEYMEFIHKTIRYLINRQLTQCDYIGVPHLLTKSASK